MTAKQSTKTKAKPVANDHEDSLTIEPQNQTGKNDDLTIEPGSQTAEIASQTKQRKSQTTIKWSVTTEIETKKIVAKAAKKAGMGLFEWADRALREAGIAELTSKPQPPAKAEDIVKDIVQQFADQMKASQEATVQVQNQLIQQQGQQIEALQKTVEAVINKPKPGLMERIFGG